MGNWKKNEDEAFLLRLNQLLAVADFEKDRVEISNAYHKPILYIVGAPRSGTTLAHQVLAAALPLDYVDNIVARFWLRPSVGINLSRILLGEERHKQIVYRSRLGVSEGVAGPHEFGYFWNHWFRYDLARTHHLAQDELARIDTLGLKNVLEDELLTNAREGFLFKNLACGFQAPLLARLHSNSLFIHIVRGRRSTTASILHWRYRLTGSFEQWFSLKPSSYPLANLVHDPVAQVVQQVDSIRSEMAETLSQSGVSAMEARYEEICEDPAGFVGRVAERLADMGCTIQPRQVDFPALALGERGSSLPDEYRHRLEALCQD